MSKDQAGLALITHHTQFVRYICAVSLMVLRFIKQCYPVLATIQDGNRIVYVLCDGDLIKDLYVTYERDLQVRQIIERWLNQLTVPQKVAK